jgi:hypothetical protein
MCIWLTWCACKVKVPVFLKKKFQPLCSLQIPFFREQKKKKWYNYFRQDIAMPANISMTAPEKIFSKLLKLMDCGLLHL